MQAQFSVSEVGSGRELFMHRSSASDSLGGK